MKKILICFIACLSFFITSCGKNKDAGGGNRTEEIHRNTILNIKQHYDGIFSIDIEENVIFQIRTDLDKTIEKQIQLEYENEVLYDYGIYLHKIWVLNVWKAEDIQVHHNGFSFYITRIEKGEIEGKISTGMYTARPNYYMNSDEGIWVNPEFSGTIFNGHAKCHFKDRQGNEGILEIELLDEDNITASVEYVDVVNEEKAVLAEGKFNFRPYNLSDDESWKTVNVTIERNMGIWGDVQIVGGKATSGRFDYGFACLVNENGDIFYEFGVPFHTGAQIVDIQTEDYNGDGLMDVKLIEQYYANDIDDVEWLLLQREDGTFDLKSD